MTEPGGVTIPIMYCVFNGAASITHYPVDFDQGLYECLPNLYAVCIANTTNRKKVLVGGIFIKTSYTHEDPGFVDAVTGLIGGTPILSSYIANKFSLLPAKLGVVGSEPLAEEDMVRLMSKQYLKYSAGGNA